MGSACHGNYALLLGALVREWLLDWGGGGPGRMTSAARLRISRWICIVRTAGLAWACAPVGVSGSETREVGRKRVSTESITYYYHASGVQRKRA